VDRYIPKLPESVKEDNRGPYHVASYYPWEQQKSHDHSPQWETLHHDKGPSNDTASYGPREQQIHVPQMQYLHTCIALALKEYLSQLIADSSGNDKSFHPFIISAILGASTAHIDKRQLPHLAAFLGVSADEMQEQATNYISSGAGQFQRVLQNWYCTSIIQKGMGGHSLFHSSIQTAAEKR